MKTRNTCTSDCKYRRKALCRRGCTVFFSRVTLYPPCGQQSDVVQSATVSASAEHVLSGRRNGYRRLQRAYGNRLVQAYRRDGCRDVNAGSGWQDRLCCSMRCGMHPHRRVVGALFLTISASKGGQMYHTDVFSLSDCRSVFTATRRRSSQAAGSLVAVVDDRATRTYYQQIFFTVKSPRKT